MRMIPEPWDFFEDSVIFVRESDLVYHPPNKLCREDYPHNISKCNIFLRKRTYIEAEDETSQTRDV